MQSVTFLESGSVCLRFAGDTPLRPRIVVSATSPNGGVKGLVEHGDAATFRGRRVGSIRRQGGDTRGQDEGGKEVTEETFFEDYKEVQGVKQATKLTVKRDGKLYLEGEMSDYQYSETLDASVFAKP